MRRLIETVARGAVPEPLRARATRLTTTGRADNHATAPKEVRRMARIPLVDLSDPDLDPELRKRLAASPMIQGLGLSPGGAPNVIRAMANHPDMLAAGFMAGYHPSSVITTRHRELAYLTASVLNHCHY